MKRFLFKLSVFILIQLVLLSIVLFAGHNRQSIGYMAAFDDKVELLKNHDRPSFIVLGGSNVAFGFDSPEFEKQIGLPTINTGLHGSLGLDLYLELAEKYVRKGDQVLLLPEWGLIAGQFESSPIQKHQLLRDSSSARRMYFSNWENYTKEFFDEFALPEIAYMLQEGTKFRSEEKQKEMARNAKIPGVYSRLNFNERGDFIGHHGLGVTKDIRSMRCNISFKSEVFELAVKKINDLADALEKRGATLYFAYPPIPTPFYDEFEKEIQIGHEYLSQNLRIPILHHPQQTAYPVNHFFDTVKHLNRKGKAERTSLLIGALTQHEQRTARAGDSYQR